MAGDTTKQMLSRLTWLPDRDATLNGSMIAGQEYDDVYFAGGEILNVSLQNISISGDIAITGDVSVDGDISADNLSGTNTGDQTITLTGDVTGSGTGTFATTLATVNSDVGTYGSSTQVPVVTTNEKGLITAVSTQDVSVSIDDSSFKVISGTNAQDLFAKTDLALLNARTTGIRYGGIVTVTGGTGTSATVDITAGAGQILDNTDAESPTFTEVSWTSKSALTLSSTSPSITYWYIDDNSDTVKQTTTAPTREDYRTRIYLARTSYTASLSVITGISSIVNPVQQEGASIRDLSSALGSLRSDGLSPTSSGANLKLKISSGGIYTYGSNYDTNYIDPHVTTYATFDTGVSDSFRYATPSGVIATDQTDVQVANYAPAGVVTAIPGSSSRVGIHFVFRFGGAGGNVRLVYGDNYYVSVTEAIEALSTIDPLSLAPSGFDNAFLLGAIIATKAETSLVNSTFVVTNAFGMFGGALVTAGTGYLEIANNLSDVASVSTSRTNLDVYSQSEVDNLIPTLTDWVAYTPTFTGFGTVTNIEFYSRRVGDTLEVKGNFTAGTVTGVEAQVTIGFNGVDGGITINSSKIGDDQNVGGFARESAFSGAFCTLASGGDGFVGFNNGASTGLSPAIGTNLVSSSDDVSIYFAVPITGW